MHESLGTFAVINYMAFSIHTIHIEGQSIPFIAVHPLCSMYKCTSFTHNLNRHSFNYVIILVHILLTLLCCGLIVLFANFNCACVRVFFSRLFHQSFNLFVVCCFRFTLCCHLIILLKFVSYFL